MKNNNFRAKYSIVNLYIGYIKLSICSKCLIFYLNHFCIGIERYDMYKRDPLYNQQHLTRIWEISLSIANYHPSVTAMTKNLIMQKPIDDYHGNIT